MTLKVGMQHWILEYYQVCSNDDPGLTLTYFTARSNLVPYAFVWEKVKTMDFSETIVVYDIKVGRCSQLNKYMKFYEYKRSWSNSLRFNNLKHLFLSNLKAKFHVELPWDGGMKVCSNGPGHMAKMATITNMVKTFNNLLLWNRKADDLETWYTALST